MQVWSGNKLHAFRWPSPSPSPSLHGLLSLWSLLYFAFHFSQVFGFPLRVCACVCVRACVRVGSEISKAHSLLRLRWKRIEFTTNENMAVQCLREGCTVLAKPEGKLPKCNPWTEHSADITRRSHSWRTKRWTLLRSFAYNCCPSRLRPSTTKQTNSRTTMASLSRSSKCSRLCPSFYVAKGIFSIGENLPARNCAASSSSDDFDSSGGCT